MRYSAGMSRWVDHDEGDDWDAWEPDEPDDEGPSGDDIARFGQVDSSEDVAYCPSCKTEVWFDADRCPHCGQWVSVEEGWDNSSVGRWPYMFVVIVVILAAVGMALLF